jgi:hypothetical protein
MISFFKFKYEDGHDSLPPFPEISGPIMHGEALDRCCFLAYKYRAVFLSFSRNYPGTS